jgi:hypothetical protein
MKATVRENLQYGAHVALRKSFLLTGLYVLYFIIAQLVGFAHIIEFRYVNYVIAFIMGYYTLKAVYVRNDYYVEYFTGLIIGMLIIILGQFWYSILFFIYLNLDHAFMGYLLTQLPQNVVAPSVGISLTLLSEGIGLSPVIALTLMQYFKWTAGRWTHAT